MLVHTDVGPVQIIGADYVGRGRETHIPELLARFPRHDGALRIDSRPGEGTRVRVELPLRVRS